MWRRWPFEGRWSDDSTADSRGLRKWNFPGAFPRQVELEDGQAVQLIVKEEPVLPQMIRKAVSVFDGLSEDEINEIERIALARQIFL